ncbi:uncharacterized protein LOC144073017 isoform X2 [Stigmatopora argus]
MPVKRPVGKMDLKARGGIDIKSMQCEPSSASQMGVPCPALASAPVPSLVPALALAPVPAPPAVRLRGRVDVRTRLGRGRLGYSSFRSEYGRRAGAPVATGSGGRPAGRPYASAKLPEHPPLAARAESRPGGRSREPPPTKRQLDAQLERYMSRCKSRLDADLDDYMARSKKRLDADLDEYMSAAGSSYWD